MIPSPHHVARRNGASVKAERAAAPPHGEHAALSSAAAALFAHGGAA
jgi:hypothetical protein